MIRGTASRACTALAAVTAVVISCCLAWMAGGARAAEILTLVPEAGPALIVIKGELTASDIKHFSDKTASIRQATVLFESRGGLVIAGLGIGQIIRSRGFATAVSASAECMSACALAWLAGSQRFMAEDARIGFHAAYYMKRGKPRHSRSAESVVLDYLNRLALTGDAIAYVTRSPPSRLSMLTFDRARALGIAVLPYGPDILTGSTDAAPESAASAMTRLAQVDLYGLNLQGMPIAADSADDCEARCRGRADCAAFTFNTAHAACFLKASAEVAVGHPAAISGYRGRIGNQIRRLAMTIEEATDYPGNDVAREEGTTFEACLMSCGDSRSCKVFTYVVERHECWLKNDIGSAEPRAGLVSGVK